MTTAKKIRQIVADYPDDYVFAASDIDCGIDERSAAVRQLQRMAERGELSKLSNGRYFKPRVTIFGNLQPSTAQILKEFMVKDGKVIGYLTGAEAFARYSLSTQISSEIQIGTNQYRRPLRRGNYKISFVLQPNAIEDSDVELIQLLDCIKFITKIPGTSTDEACRRIICIVAEFDSKKLVKLTKYTLKYAPFVRALLGAILEYIGSPEALTLQLSNSLNGVSKYRIPVSINTLPTKQNWRIYEPAC